MYVGFAVLQRSIYLQSRHNRWAAVGCGGWPQLSDGGSEGKHLFVAVRCGEGPVTRAENRERNAGDVYVWFRADGYYRNYQQRHAQQRASFANRSGCRKF